MTDRAPPVSPDPAVASPARRIVSLDALRGLAVFGIVPMNVVAFAMPGAAYYNPVAWRGESSLDLALWALAFVVIEDKFRALFAMMFGAGVAIMLDRGGKHPLRGHYLRMAVMFAIGFIHSLLLFSGDVLRLYAVAGLVLLICVRWRPRTLLLSAAGIVAIYCLAAGYVAWGWLDYWWHWSTEPGWSSDPLLPAQRAFGADPDTIHNALVAGRETLAERVDRRLANLQAMAISGAVVMPTTLASMLAGIALWRSGLLAGEWPPKRAYRLAAKLAAWSLPPTILLAAFAFWSGFHGVVIAANALVFSAPFDIVLGIALAAFAMGLFACLGPLTERLAAAGRMALTIYLGTSVVLAAIYHSWGLGLFGQLDRTGVYASGLLPIVLSLVLAPAWLRHFRQGPAEWAWRSIAQGKLLPMRRSSTNGH